MRRLVRKFLLRDATEKAILNQAKEEKNIVYGGQSIKKQIGIYARPTQDYDIFSLRARKSAYRTEKRLDKLHGFNMFYVKPAKHKGTYKVMDYGTDGKRGTSDDENIVDYTKMPRPAPKYLELDGVRYRELRYEARAKRLTLKDAAYQFRHAKDNEDLIRMKLTGRKL